LSLNIKKKANLISLIPISLSNIGDVYLEKHKPNEAKKMYLEAYQLAKQIGSLEFIRDAFRGLFRVDSALGNHSQALQNFKQYVIFRDSLFNAENQKKGLSMMFEYEYSKKHVQDSITYAKQKEIQQAKIEKQQTEIKAKQTQQYMLFGGLGLVFLFSGFMYNRFKKTQKQKQIIEHQQLETESQKRLLEVKNKEIHDSITYAKRIQEAILPSSSLLNEYLKNGFVYFNPKDIVSGDFYWLEKVGNAVFLAAADCTGHGVPGAMVSVVCANALSKALLEENITETGKLLDRTRELVIERFDNSNEDVKDGMDISLCKLEGKTVQWSGANNPLWVVRAHASEIEEYKADKQPIGKSANQTPFSSVTLSLNSGDSLYLFTDGYADQFGGEKGKKFMYKPLKELLLSMSTSSMDSQRNQLETQFQQWKGELEQVDDVCVIGIRI
jgi:serine phosphatase RsbU (regulator of sigma subunit)